MRATAPRYPVDRYLVESSNKMDMVNIIDDDIWLPEPALRPEDEIILRKLQEMLQSTADDLKLLSGELSKYHEPGVQVKTTPMPLDEEFNEKVHIEEVVNAKFHGHKIIDNTQITPRKTQKDILDGILHSLANKSKNKSDDNMNVKVSSVPVIEKRLFKRNLGISRTKSININGKTDSNDIIKEETKISREKENERLKKAPSVTYSELTYEYVKPKVALSPQKQQLQVQEMPSINIRGELREQKVLQLDIMPDAEGLKEILPVTNNAVVIEMHHRPALKPAIGKPLGFIQKQNTPIYPETKPTIRKVTKLPICDSSESTNNVSSDTQHFTKRQNQINTILRQSPRTVHVVSRKNKKSIVNKKDTKHPQVSLDEWKKKLNAVYKGTISSKGLKAKKESTKNSNTNVAKKNRLPPSLNNAEYIPYSKLTLGGVTVSDIEREISNMPNKNDVALSPILDKILSSRENSFLESPKKNNLEKKVLSTSDENLLQEVITIEKQVTEILNDKKKEKLKIQHDANISLKDSDSYIDDFEDDKSDDLKQNLKINKSESMSIKSIDNSNGEENDNDISYAEKIPLDDDDEEEENNQNKTFTKISNLSFKNQMDIFEYVHCIDTQDTGTQSNTTNKISPKETQTSPRVDKTIVQPIRNDLWPSLDPKREVEKMFKLEKELIKKLIVDEYGDLFEKNLCKPSTSKLPENDKIERNMTATQKNTQTSPARVKNVMTSPTKTKTRATSPFSLSLTVNKQTSPLVVVSNEDNLKVEIENNDDLGISVNLSSPRFSLRLPQSSREVLTNLGNETLSKRIKTRSKKSNSVLKYTSSSSSSVDNEYSSSDISSLGEINRKFKKLRKNRMLSLSEISSSSSPSKCNSETSGAIIPLRSEGEASIGQIYKKKSNKIYSRSEGEISLGQMK